jgi:hypothetical protein
MDDAAVVTGLMFGDGRFTLEDDDGGVGVIAQQVVRGGEPDDPGADHAVAVVGQRCPPAVASENITSRPWQNRDVGQSRATTLRNGSPRCRRPILAAMSSPRPPERVAGDPGRSFETSLAEGLLYERRLFHSAFATTDQTEGMAAFTEKRTPNFTHR